MKVRGRELPFDSPPPNLDELIRVRLNGDVTFLPALTNDEDPADVFVDLAAQSDVWRTALAATAARVLEQWVSDFRPGNAERSAAVGELCYLAARIGSIASMEPLAQLVNNRNATDLVAPGEDLRLRALRALIGLLGNAPYADASRHRRLLEETLTEPRLALVSATGLIGVWPDERESVLRSLPDQVERGDLLDVAIDITFRRRG
jgi:hypothetical protein